MSVCRGQTAPRRQRIVKFLSWSGPGVSPGAEVDDRCRRAARMNARWQAMRDEIMASCMAYRHGLRASEVCDLQWHQVELNTGRLHVRRSKRGTPSVHPVRYDEIRALRRLQREQPPSPYVFTSGTRRSDDAQELPHTCDRSASASAPGCRSRSTRTCFGTGVASAYASGEGHRADRFWMGRR